MKRVLMSGLAVAVLAGAASAGEISQAIDINITPENGQQAFSMQGFDTMGGQRVLNAVRFHINAELSVDFAALNYSDFAIPAGDWQVIPGFTMFFYAEPEGSGGEGDSIFAGIGGIGWDGVTGDLPAGSGNPLFGEPGRFEFSRSGSLDSTMLDEGAVARNFFTSNAQIDASLAPFSFPEVFGPPGSNISLESLVTQTGTLTITYEYSTIPAPGGVAMLGLAGFAGLRRRR
ncbi:MAG: hypothetical protein ACF8MJ_01595 [Phycisphaerales bacterium JB050]